MWRLQTCKNNIVTHKGENSRLIRKLNAIHLCLFLISDIDMYNNNNAVELKVNGVPFQISSQIYQHPTGNFQITLLAVTIRQISLFEI